MDGINATEQIYRMDNRAHGHPGPGLKYQLHPLTVEFITFRFLPTDDPVLNGYITKYRLTDPDVYTTIFDKDSRYIINSQALADMAVSLGKAKNIPILNLVVIVTGTGRQQFQTDVFKSNTVNVTVTPVLDWTLAVQLMSVNLNHIVNRSKLSVLCSKLPLAENRYTLVPVPSLDGTEHLSGDTIEIKLESTLFFDKIYYINLDKRTDRRTHMEEQLKRFNLSATRVGAMDGTSLPWSNEQYGPQTTFWTPGALGYCISYSCTIADALKGNSQRVLILDDDAVLLPNFYEVLQKAFQTLPDDWHMLYLAANHGQNKPSATERISENIYRMKGSVGSHAIIINRPAFEPILNFACTPYGPLDVFLSVYQQMFPCYITYPGLATQLPGYSDIINKDVNYGKDIDYVNHI
jgi:GR25 family glycosyltransferase involved in LPS biosynthesis